jgi:hypothetical protein
MKLFSQPKIIASGLFAGLLASLSPSAARAGGTIFEPNQLGDTIGEYTTAGATVNAALISGLGDPLGIAISDSSVPEASTWVMALTGFAALAFAGFRRARSRAASA